MIYHIKVEVNEKHIMAGQQNNPYTCPIAWALRDMGFYPKVDKSNAWLGVEKLSEINEEANDIVQFGYAYLPENAELFITEYDNNINVDPITFWLEVHRYEP